MTILPNQIAGRNFRVWEYSIGHQTLLLRSPGNPLLGVPTLDLRFQGVELICPVAQFPDLSLRSGDRRDAGRILEEHGLHVSLHDITVLVSQGREYPIVAARVEIVEHHFDILYSPSLSHGINFLRQGRYIPGHHHFRPGGPEFTHPNPQALISLRLPKSSLPGPGRFFARFEQPFGRYVNESGDLSAAKYGMIYVDLLGMCHIVPKREFEGKVNGESSDFTSTFTEDVRRACAIMAAPMERDAATSLEFLERIWESLHEDELLIDLAMCLGRPASPWLHALSGSHIPEVRWQAAEVMGFLRTGQNRLMEMQADEDPYVRRVVFLALMDCRRTLSQEQTDSIVNTALADPDAYNRMIATRHVSQPSSQESRGRNRPNGDRDLTPIGD